MPYIRQSERIRAAKLPETPGELNYAITMMVLDYMSSTGKSDLFTYKSLNEAIGVLECVKQELYRRVVSVLEDAKCAENGDVY